LWNELIGFIFIVLAVVAGFSAVRTALALEGKPENMVKLIMTALFVIVMGAYGISSFRRARRISRS
jgi:hypothetical protein